MPHAFTERELEVLELLARSNSDKQVAKKLGLSDLTARTYRTRLFRKAGVHNICALIYRAYWLGWIAIPEDEPRA